MRLISWKNYWKIIITWLQKSDIIWKWINVEIWKLDPWEFIFNSPHSFIPKFLN